MATRQGEEFVKAASKTDPVATGREEQIEQAVDEIIERATGETPTIAARPAGTALAVGDLAKMTDSGIRGEILELNRQRKEAVLGVLGKRMTVKLKALEPVSV